MNAQSDMQLDMAGVLAGFRFYPGHFDRAGQMELLAAVRAVLQTAPLFTPYAEIGSALQRAYVELRAARLGLR
jgi:alkylated DNA repair dioxygenase AlkB